MSRRRRTPKQETRKSKQGRRIHQDDYAYLAEAAKAQQDIGGQEPPSTQDGLPESEGEDANT